MFFKKKKKKPFADVEDYRRCVHHEGKTHVRVRIHDFSGCDTFSLTFRTFTIRFIVCCYCQKNLHILDSFIYLEHKTNLSLQK